MTVFTTARHLSLFWATLIQSMSPSPSWISILYCRPIYSWVFPLDVPTKSLYAPLLSTSRAICPTHLFLLDLFARIIFGQQYIWLNSLCRFIHSPVTSSLLGSNIFLSTLISNTLSLCSSLYASDQVSCPYKTTGKITVQYISIFIFLDCKLEDDRFRTGW